MGMITQIPRHGQTMSSLEIAELTGKRHSHILRDIRAMIDQLGDERNSGSVQYRAGNGEMRPMHNLDYDQTMTLLTGYSTPLRHKVVKRWRELETPQTRAEALRLAADLEEQNAQLEARIKIDAPKIMFHDDVAVAENCISFGDWGKTLGVGRNTIMKWVRDSKYIMYDSSGYSVPYQKYIDMGLFKVIESPVRNSSGGTRVHLQTVITGKGQSYLYNKIISDLGIIDE